MEKITMRLLIFLFVSSVIMSACTGSELDPVRVDTPGMDNSVQVGEVLIGSQPSVEALSYLADQGFKVIVSTRAENELNWDERAIVDSLGMRFVRIPMPSPVTEITDEQVNMLADAMNSADGPVVLHCGSGNRVSGLWAVWLAEKEGLSAEAAVAAAEQTGMTRVRPVVMHRLGLPDDD